MVSFPRWFMTSVKNIVYSFFPLIIIYTINRIVANLLCP